MRLPRHRQERRLPLPSLPGQAVRRADGLRRLRAHDRQLTASRAKLPPSLPSEGVPAGVGRLLLRRPAAVH